MKKKKAITTLNIGNEGVLNPNTELIRFEGTNEDFFWRIYGDVLNPNVKIVVPPTHYAVYIKDGILQNQLPSGSYPVFETTNKGFLGFGRKLDAAVVDIIFLNRTIKFNARWGTVQPIIMRDPITEHVVHVRGHGEFEVGVAEPKQFYLQIVGADKNFNMETLRTRLYARMLSYIDDAIAKVMHEKIQTYLDIQMIKKSLGDSLVPYLNEMFVKDCGLYVYSFTISDMGIDEEEAEAIEDELETRRKELKEKMKADELANSLREMEERANARADKRDEIEWQRKLLLKQLEMADKEKYYEVLKILAANSKTDNGRGRDYSGKTAENEQQISCPKCGWHAEPGSRFCPKCGTTIGIIKKKCTKCGKEMDPEMLFCSFCGTKLD